MNQGKGYRLKADPNLGAGRFINLSAAGCKSAGKIKDPLTGKKVDGFVHFGRLGPGEEVVVDVIEFPERLQAAVDRGDLTISSAAK